MRSALEALARGVRPVHQRAGCKDIWQPGLVFLQCIDLDFLRGLAGYVSACPRPTPALMWMSWYSWCAARWTVLDQALVSTSCACSIWSTLWQP